MNQRTGSSTRSALRSNSMGMQVAVTHLLSENSMKRVSQEASRPVSLRPKGR